MSDVSIVYIYSIILMKTFLKIIGALAVVLITVVIVLNLYFTDDRLRTILLPQIQGAAGSEVEIDHLSVTFFRTFPRFGLEMKGLRIPDPFGDPVASFETVLLTVELFPLLKNEISITKMDLITPEIYYTVYPDSSSNIDFLLDDEDSEPSEMNLNIPRIVITNGSLFYNDLTTLTQIRMNGLDTKLSLFYSDLIETNMDATLASLSLDIDGINYIREMPLRLNQRSILDLENERVTISEGIFTIRGLSLGLTGAASSWSGDPHFSLQFQSTSDNFGELLNLAPPGLNEQLSKMTARGTLQLEGSIEGVYTEVSYPRIDLTVAVANGYLQNPDLPESIEDIHFDFTFNNDLASIQNLRARAGINNITGSGEVVNPLEDSATFTLDLNGDMNLNTVHNFYAIESLGIDELAGMLNFTATAAGLLSAPEDTRFSGSFNLTDGRLKYTDVPKTIENINFSLSANQDLIRIDESGFTAADNRFTLTGTISRPLDENARRIDLRSGIHFDLATIKEFYPIDEDTLAMRGILTADIVLRGKPDPDQIESLLQQSTFDLSNGYFYHSIVNQPLEDIRFVAQASGRRLAISEARFKTGENQLAMRGSVENYLSDNPIVDLTFDGTAMFSSISNYYTLDPWIQELTGRAVMNLNTRGPINDIRRLALNGALEVFEVTASGDSIPLPVTNLSGKMNVTPNNMTLERFSMNYGLSDINLQGTLRNYMNFLDENSSGSNIPAISGRYNSRLLNMDEMIDWEDESDDPFPINLPNMTADVDARIDRMIILGLSIGNMTGRGLISPTKIEINDARATLFDGTATGRMDWNVPDPLKTSIQFDGQLTGLTAETFFRETGFLGKNSTIHQYMNGEFNAKLSYFTQLEPSLAPDITTAKSNGSFGMGKARLRGHPIQVQIAQYLKISELESLVLDEWTANYTIQNSVMTLKDFKLTSGNLGFELAGTLHMVTDQIDYNVTVFLPERFKRGIATVISGRAADALQLEDGRIAVPLRITGTTASPQVRPNTDVIERVIQDRIRDGAGDVLRRLFGG